MKAIKAASANTAAKPSSLCVCYRQRISILVGHPGVNHNVVKKYRLLNRSQLSDFEPVFIPDSFRSVSSAAPNIHNMQGIIHPLWHTRLENYIVGELPSILKPRLLYFTSARGYICPNQEEFDCDRVLEFAGWNQTRAVKRLLCWVAETSFNGNASENIKR